MKVKKIILLLGIVLILAFLLIPRIERFFYPLPYQKIITENANRYQVDPYLIAAVIKVESRFNPSAISSKGARGLMQIMPATGFWAAERIGITVSEEELLEPEINIRIGTWYLADLSKEFQGELPIIIAAYNGGRGKVNSWLRNEVWDGTLENRGDIPYPETRNFVARVLTAHENYRSIYAE